MATDEATHSRRATPIPSLNLTYIIGNIRDTLGLVVTLEILYVSRICGWHAMRVAAGAVENTCPNFRMFDLL
jgi:hypothetical protein